MRLGLIPQQFHPYLDQEYEHCILEIYWTKELEIICDEIRAAFFDGQKSHPIYEDERLLIPDSIYIKAKINNRLQRILFEKTFDNDFFTSCNLMRVAMTTTPRVHKYLALYKVYESLTSKHERDMIFSSIRHSLAHSSTELTRPNVANKLNELFGSLQINPEKYRDKKVLFISYWNMLVQVDKIFTARLKYYIEKSSPFLEVFKQIK